MKTAVVPYEKKLPIQYVYEFRLVEENINLNDRDTVKSQLPDILGRALARSWVDENYRLQLEKDVHATLASGGVRIHNSYICEYEKSSGQRAKIVVYEQTGKMKLKVCGLSLTMVASR
ncbi:MAG: hypothetical protein CMF52_01060 [Legionellales bacterium]|nr:hypothetical protein [Legionellales bacterium]|tara:strand:- start:1367 stop:1720 length:354 start_codon:yes stop_codon:yes gene_type:complete